MVSLEREEETSLPLEEHEERRESQPYLEPRERASWSAICMGRSYGERRYFFVGRGLILRALGGSYEEAGVEISLCWVDGEYGE